jgi:hypothetical protein
MDFILEIPGNLSGEMCKKIIEKFDGDDRKYKGVTADMNPDSRFKRSVDLAISSIDDWKDIDTYLCTQLRDGVVKYREHIHGKVGKPSWEDYKIEDTGYQIQKTVKGEYYSWHSDEMMSHKRLFTFLWYLNTLDPIIDGGGTAFHPSIAGGKIVKPEEGKLILFPATWTYIHMGLPLITDEKNKYICTGWISADDAV